MLGSWASCAVGLKSVAQEVKIDPLGNFPGNRIGTRNLSLKSRNTGPDKSPMAKATTHGTLRKL